jgi:threonyl-tRNA synthetase
VHGLTSFRSQIGGKWPFWLNPRQIVVVPVSEKSLDYAERVYKQIFAHGFYVDLDASDEQLKKKIAMGQVEQYNFILVVGEVINTTLSIQSHCVSYSMTICSVVCL